MRRVLACIALAAAALGFTGCASTSDPYADETRPSASTIPWNRPASWEGPGVYGSALNAR